jgi:opacity protein-like surface antigen
MFRKLLITLGILCVLSGTRAKADDTAYAYCPLGEGYVFLYDSVDGFQVSANLKCGEKLQVLDASDKTRTKVRTANGREGWVPKSSLNVPVTTKPAQAAAPTTAVPQQAPAPTPAQAMPQLKAQPLPPQPKVQPQAPAEPQTAAAPGAQPESQPQTATQPQVQAQRPTPSEPVTPLQSDKQPSSAPQASSQQTGAQAMPAVEPQPETPVQAETQLEAAAQPQPEPQPQPEAQPEPEAQPQPEGQPLRKAPKVKPQPEPAATAFTPFSTLGYEQYVPRLEVYGGYSFMNAGTSGLAARQNLSGLEVSVDAHINRWLAGEIDGTAYYKNLTIISLGTFPLRDYVAMGGPRVNIRKAFFHALVGIDHVTGSSTFYAIGSKITDNALAGGAGGGVQWNVTRKLALRTSADYVMSRFEGLTQSNVRVTLGIVFQAGNVRAE